MTRLYREFWIFDSYEESRQLDVCPDCGALVADTEAHDRHHNEQ